MIERNLLLVISLVLVISLLTMMSQRLKISYPIFLVIAGLLISLVPGVPNMRINPDFVFLIFLPPILFAAAWQIPWDELWRLKRSVTLLGFGLVFFTSTLIAWLSHHIIPGFTLALGFVLGGIISPPDAVAATSVLKELKIPRRVLDLLEGESLVNDAASLIVFRFAIIAVVTGTFSFWQASKNFVLVALMGILIGLMIAFIIYIIQKYFTTNTAIDAAITLTAPFLMYLAAENFHFSGVLSVVAGGLFLSYHNHDFLTYESRLNISALWETLTFLLNGFIFIMIGLQMPYIVSNFTQNTVKEALYYGLIISLAVILIRILWVFAVNRIRNAYRKITRSEHLVMGLKETFLVSWCGMRGVVSLAAALSIPLFLREGEEFPYRYLILFITFMVIIVTLVFQGLTISPLIKLLKIEDLVSEKQRWQEQEIKVKLAKAALTFLDEKYKGDLETNESFRQVRDRYERVIRRAENKVSIPRKDNLKLVRASISHYRHMLLEIIRVKRVLLRQYLQTHEFEEGLVREKQKELDLEEARLRSKKI